MHRADHRRRARRRPRAPTTTTASASRIVRGARAVREQGQAAASRSRTPSPAAAARDPSAPCSSAARAPSASRDLDEHRDPVAFGDRLAEPSGPVTDADAIDRRRVALGACRVRRAGPRPRTRVDRLGSRVVADVKRVCLLGAESTGKTTLAAALADAYDTLWNPEYGRAYTRDRAAAEAPWTSAEFTHIARIHCWYEDFLAGLATRVLFSRHRRVHDSRVPRGVPRRSRRPASRSSPSGATTCTSSAGSTCRGGTTGSASSRSSAAGCTSGTSSARGRAASPGSSSKGRASATRGRASQVERLATTEQLGSTRESACVATSPAQSWPQLLLTGNRTIRIESGWWVGVPRRTRYERAKRLSDRSGARRSSARGTPRSPTGSGRSAQPGRRA